MSRARLGDIASAVAGELIGDPGREVGRIASFDSADDDSITFVAKARLNAQLATSAAACVIVAPVLRDAAQARGATIVCPDPYLAYARLTQWWAARQRRAASQGVHASAVIEPGAVIDPSASIGALAFVGRGARVDARAVIGAQAHVGEDALVGSDTVLKPHAVLSDACRIGERGLVHGGAVIGADGFGFAPTREGWQKIEQLGAVVIGDDVEIGANTCIDRGALGDTLLGNGVKLDNLIQIGHNVRIGDHTIMAGCSGIAGSTVIGRHCLFGGSSQVMGHLVIVDHVEVGAASVISHSLHRPGRYGGYFPFDDIPTWSKNAATLRNLHALRERVRALENKT
jgi:UDP-3-O-[3-hydroxymyristoyl] glucosamine N-acyltransferase